MFGQEERGSPKYFWPTNFGFAKVRKTAGAADVGFGSLIFCIDFVVSVIFSGSMCRPSSKMSLQCLCLEYFGF